MNIASIVINAVIFLTTLVIVILYFRKDGGWNPEKGLGAFRYFTVLSNVFCALSALVMAIGGIRGGASRSAMLLKYTGTVSVTVTLLTVFLFLAPTQGGLLKLLRRDNLYMHLLGPLMAIASFCLLEKKEMRFAEALLGVLPVLMYGVMYLYRVVFAPEEKRWEDFYGFNSSGRWPIAFGAMVAGTLIICAAFWLI